MVRLAGSVGAVVLIAGGIGCAMSAPPDLTPNIDSNLPGLDASSDPVPAKGQGLPPKSDSGSGESGEPDSGRSTTDAGAKPGTPSDSGVDSAPPPATSKPAPGEVLITEVMYDSSGTEPQAEWIELHNRASTVRALTGLTLEDGGGRKHVIGAGITISGGAYVVLVRNKAGAIAAKVPAGVIAYEYGAGLADTAGILLANGGTGGIALLNGATKITEAAYGGWFSQSGGSSVQLHLLDPSQTSVKTSWCLSSNAWAAGSEKGTPGAAEDCP